MDESTPRPWKRDAGAEVFGVMIRDGSDRWLVTANGDHNTGDGPHPQFPSNAEMDANARLVVRAVNAHEKLVEALREWDRWADGWCPTQCSCAISSKAIAEKTRAALALAEQE